MEFDLRVMSNTFYYFNFPLAHDFSFPGMFPEKESDEVFEGHLLRLRTLIKKRTAVYGAEEKALRVMLEGEQEEERKRDHEKRQKKERDKLLQRKREINMMLFGGNYQHKFCLWILVKKKIHREGSSITTSRQCYLVNYDV